MADVDPESLDEEAENAPLGPLAGAVLGTLALAAGVVWSLAAVLGLFGLDVVPGLSLVAVGFTAFVGSMLAWDPDVEVQG